MLAWRSLLSRSHPLLSRLRPAHRHASHPTAVLGGKNLICSRGYASNPDGDSHAEANRQHRAAAAATTKRHLYLVLDDGIHKLDLTNDDGLDGRTRRLPEPPVLRVGLPTIGDRAQFAAVGSSIVAICTSPTIDPWGKDDVGGVLIYDTKTAVQVVSPQLPRTLLLGGGYEAAIAVGNRLYMFESNGSERYYKYEDYHPSGLHCLTNDGDDRSGPGRDKFWDWRPLSPSSRWCWSWNENFLMLPFHADNITAHAVHAPPHDYEILVSDRNANMTFSFSTTRREWTERGEWQLPVVGHAHYDHGLDAWLGLHAVNDRRYYDHRRTDGYLCIGNVTSAPSEWKVGREKLFCLDEDATAGWSHVDAKLMPMASHEGGSEYCLMERLRAPEGEDDKKCLGNGCLLRLTSFCVERDEDGEPVAKARRRARSYYVSSYNENFDAQVFWM